VNLSRLGGNGLATAVLAGVLALANPAVQALPSFAEVKAAHRPSDFTLLDRRGVPIQTLRMNDAERRLDWVALADMSPALLHAVVLSEDQRFYEHSGVDWAAVARSAWANLWNTRTRGASTLTMQLAGLIDEGLARPAAGRSLSQKIDQAWTATRLDSTWRKSDILEAYLNSVAFRGEIVGINALSQTLFGKHPSGLDAHEAAIAAALVRGPNAPARTVVARACGVLQAQHLDCGGVAALAETALVRRGGMPLGEQLAPHVARQVLQSSGAPRQASSLDAGLQRVAVSALAQQLNSLGGKQVEDGAVLVLDNATGEVLAWVGSSGALSAAAQVDGVLARRQPGSTLKPFVYELAFEQRLLTPASLLDDAPIQIATSGGLYLPQNYDADYKGWVSARTALGASLNVPAVRVAAMLGPDALHQRLNAWGLALQNSAGHYGQSLALGGAEVTLLSLANAYRALARGGQWSPVRLQPRSLADASAAAVDKSVHKRLVVGDKAVDNPLHKSVENRLDRPVDGTPDKGGHKPVGKSAEGALVAAAQGAAAESGASALGEQRAGVARRVATPEASYLVTDILADNAARLRTFGSDSALATRGFAAVKTGTSKDMRDNWCVGFTERYTIGVWVGNASGEPMRQVSGVSGAAPVWQALVRHLHREQPSRPPTIPPGVVRARVPLAADAEPARDEVFLRGTEQRAPQASGQLAVGMPLGITSPSDGSSFALDPDMPAQAQRVRFEGEDGSWWLNGQRLGAGRGLWWWPQPGRHQLTLRGRDGRPIQTVNFTVRAPRLATAGR
jgi:penicillin-binding protein 1C